MFITYKYITKEKLQAINLFRKKCIGDHHFKTLKNEADAKLVFFFNNFYNFWVSSKVVPGT